MWTKRAISFLAIFGVLLGGAAAMRPAQAAPPTAITGYELVQTTVTGTIVVRRDNNNQPKGTAVVASAPCPVGKTALGGGGVLDQVNGVREPDYALFLDLPGSQSEWSVTWINMPGTNDPSGATFSARLFITCANA